MKSRRRTFAAILITAVFLICAFIGWRFAAPTQTFSPGSDVRFDDVDFTALSAQAISPGEYDVVIRVKNSAKRATFAFDPKVVGFSGPEGSKLSVATLPEGATLDAGEFIERTFHVSGTKFLAEMFVSFDFGGSIGNFLDTLIYGRRRVRLEVGH